MVICGYCDGMKTNPTYVIKLTTHTTARVYHTTARVYFLHSMRKDRITKTRYATNARTFATYAAAVSFLNANAAYFGYKWEVVAQ